MKAIKGIQTAQSKSLTWIMWQPSVVRFTLPVHNHVSCELQHPESPRTTSFCNLQLLLFFSHQNINKTFTINKRRLEVSLEIDLGSLDRRKGPSGKQRAKQRLLQETRIRLSGSLHFTAICSINKLLKRSSQSVCKCFLLCECLWEFEQWVLISQKACAVQIRPVQCWMYTVLFSALKSQRHMLWQKVSSADVPVRHCSAKVPGCSNIFLWLGFYSLPLFLC